MINIVTVKNKKQEKDFVLFPFELYKGCEYWVAPIIKEELESMDKSKNPVFQAESIGGFRSMHTGRKLRFFDEKRR